MKKFSTFLFFTFLLTIIFGTIYAVGQQILRQGANDPQIQMSEVGRIDDHDHIDIAVNLAPFIVLYDKAGNPVDGNGTLDLELPKLPTGIFDYTRKNGQDRVTWQPRSGLRYAIVVTRETWGFSMAGRSLREVEIREQKLMEMVGLAWIVTMVAFSFGLLVFPTSGKK